MNDDLLNNLKQSLNDIQTLKESNPEEYKARLQELVSALKEFNENAKKLLESMQN